MNVLIIDDTVGDHEIIVDYLTEFGTNYNFFHAYTAAEGIKLYQKQSFNCVLLDYHLPDMDGLRVLKLLGEENKPTPVIMMTADGNEMVAVTAMKLGSQDYLPKKVITPTALKRAVERATERTEILRRMEQYRVELERSNRDLEQFATIVAHDLKSPLRAIAQHLAFIEKAHANTIDEKSRQSLHFAIDGASRMSQLIDALFQYAQLGFSEPHFSTVSLQDSLSASLRDLDSIISDREAKITHDELPTVYGDPILLAQLFQNLIANAIKYCKTSPHIHIGATLEENEWRIFVRDNGIGVPAGQKQKIFAIFRRLHPDEEYPGIGLGLAVCERIVKLHGGDIGVESLQDGGSEFYFTLPESAQIIPYKEAAHA